MSAQRDKHHPDGVESRQVADRDDPVLPERSRDDSDVGWGEEPGERDADWYRGQKPPHHE